MVLESSFESIFGRNHWFTDMKLRKSKRFDIYDYHCYLSDMVHTSEKHWYGNQLANQGLHLCNCIGCISISIMQGYMLLVVGIIIHVSSVVL